MNDKVTYWIEMSDYDFETAKAMLETKRYLYGAIEPVLLTEDTNNPRYADILKTGMLIRADRSKESVCNR